MADLKYKYGVRPSVRFRHARRSQRVGTPRLGKVCIIGAFPTVSETLIRCKDLDEAREKLNITPNKHDLFKINDNGTLVENPSYYAGAGALRWAFLQGTSEAGASEVLICNISTYAVKQETNTNGEQVIVKECDANGQEVLNDTLTHDTLTHDADSNGNPQSKLDIALSKLKGEDFDNLIFAYRLSHDSNVTEEATGQTDAEGRDTGIVKILEKLLNFTHESYTVKHPFGMYIGLEVSPSVNENSTEILDNPNGQSVVDSLVNTNKSTTIDRKVAESYAKIFEDPIHNAHSIYTLTFSGLKTDLREYTLPPMETAAYLCGVEAGLPVDTIMGQRALPHVIGVDEELNYDPYYQDANGIQNDGINLLGAGITCFECIDRSANTWAIVNSMQPCGYDISHLRISAFIIKQIALTPFLCNVNNDVTRESVDSVIASLKEKYVDRFVEIISIDHHIAEKRNPRCIEIYLYINFYGIIIDEIVYVAMGVEEDE